jgi:hypothetical protein
MKTPFYLISASVIFVFLAAACSKEKEKEKVTITPTYGIIDSQVAGNVYHRVYSPPLVVEAQGTGPNFIFDSIDLNNDGKQDIRFESFFNQSKGYSEGAQFTSLNSKLQVPFIWISDTSYYCSYEQGDTLFEWYYHIPPIKCTDNSEVKKADKSQDHPKTMRAGDTIYFSNTGSFTWALIPSGIGTGLCMKDSLMAAIINDTTVLGYSFTYNWWGIWNGIGIKYLSFKIEDNNVVEYGWIKLEITENRIIKIFEISCFKK